MTKPLAASDSFIISNYVGIAPATFRLAVEERHPMLVKSGSPNRSLG
jgi:hypothetical protein